MNKQSMILKKIVDEVFQRENAGLNVLPQLPRIHADVA
jgi:hypothetical protein